jgi:CheY-like chemotaxis protein
MLAAEDNAVNKKLIPRLLEKAGFPLEAADGDFLAVQAIAPMARAMGADGERCLAVRDS